jgi:putative SOS response-associated peptidase YedK
MGFVSTSAKDPKLAPINARAETVAISSMFRDAFRRHRCLIVANAFYVEAGRAQADAIPHPPPLEPPVRLCRGSGP